MSDGVIAEERDVFDPARYGFIWAEQSGRNGEVPCGWYARGGGGGEARRFIGLEGIPSADGTVWWSNVSYDDWVGAPCGWYKRRAIRHESYLPAGLDPWHVLSELHGEDPRTVDPERAVVLLAETFAAVMRRAAAMLRDGMAEEEWQAALRSGGVFVRNRLREDLLPLYRGALEFPTESNLQAAMRAGQAHQALVETGMRGSQQAVLLRLHRPRLRHALDVLGSPVPMGEMRFHGIGSLPEGLSERLESDESYRGTAWLLQTKVIEEQERFALVYGFGSGLAGRRSDRSLRHWVPSTEVFGLRRMARPVFGAAWSRGGVCPLGALLPEGVDRHLEPLCLRLGWTVGVVATALWQASCVSQAVVDSCRRGGMRGRGGLSARLVEVLSWQGVWARAADRMLMLPAALAFASDELAVLSYGQGAMLVAVLPERLGDALALAKMWGLYPRLSPAVMAALEASSYDFGELSEVEWGGDVRDYYGFDLLFRPSDIRVAIDRIVELHAAKNEEAVLSARFQALMASGRGVEEILVSEGVGRSEREAVVS